nr:MAG TPA: hypothetical protein [Caudoviricetes sp.]
MVYFVHFTRASKILRKSLISLLTIKENHNILDLD